MLLGDVLPSAQAFADRESLYAVACLSEALHPSGMSDDPTQPQEQQEWSSWHAAALGTLARLLVRLRHSAFVELLCSEAEEYASRVEAEGLAYGETEAGAGEGGQVGRGDRLATTLFGRDTLGSGGHEREDCEEDGQVPAADSEGGQGLVSMQMRSLSPKIPLPSGVEESVPDTGAGAVDGGGRVSPSQAVRCVARLISASLALIPLRGSGRCC